MVDGKNRRASALGATFATTAALVILAAAAVASPTPWQPATPMDAIPNCDHGTPPPAFHGGIETAVIASTLGAVSRVYTKNPGLCYQPADVYESGSTSWVMVASPNPDCCWFQVGNLKDRGDSCPHVYMEYKWDPDEPTLRDKDPDVCTSSITWYRFEVKKATPTAHWESKIFIDSTNQFFWGSGMDPASFPWTIDVAEYFSEVKNGGTDQSGGTNSSRLTFDQARWYTSTGTIVWADMQGTERKCDICPNPYHTYWYDGNTFEVWTDGY